MSLEHRRRFLFASVPAQSGQLDDPLVVKSHAELGGGGTRFLSSRSQPHVGAEYDETHLDGQVEADADCIRISMRGGGDLLDNRGLA